MDIRNPLFRRQQVPVAIENTIHALLRVSICLVTDEEAVSVTAKQNFEELTGNEGVTRLNSYQAWDEILAGKISFGAYIIDAQLKNIGMQLAMILHCIANHVPFAVVINVSAINPQEEKLYRDLKTSGVTIVQTDDLLLPVVWSNSFLSLAESLTQKPA
ncbi:MAG: hypothetical protein Q7S57_02800 [bacterium]|nr:hypothetical protein [bacterium]